MFVKNFLMINHQHKLKFVAIMYFNLIILFFAKKSYVNISVSTSVILLTVIAYNKPHHEDIKA